MILIGNEPEKSTGGFGSSRVRQIIGWCRNRWLRRGGGGWRPKPGYLKAVANVRCFATARPRCFTR